MSVKCRDTTFSGHSHFLSWNVRRVKGCTISSSLVPALRVPGMLTRGKPGWCPRTGFPSPEPTPGPAKRGAASSPQQHSWHGAAKPLVGRRVRPVCALQAQTQLFPHTYSHTRCLYNVCLFGRVIYVFWYTSAEADSGVISSQQPSSSGGERLIIPETAQGHMGDTPLSALLAACHAWRQKLNTSHHQDPSSSVPASPAGLRRAWAQHQCHSPERSG